MASVLEFPRQYSSELPLGYQPEPLTKKDIAIMAAVFVSGWAVFIAGICGLVTALHWVIRVTHA